MKNLLMWAGILLLVVGCSESSSLQDDIPVLPPDNSGKKLGDIVVYHDVLEDVKIVVVGKATQFIVSFERTIGGQLLEFEPSDAGLPVILEDQEGNLWDVFGFAVDGPRTGQRLKSTQSLMGYWFSFATFYPGIQIFPQAEKGDFFGEIITGSDGWSVPKNEVRSGGVGRDGIPAVSDPEFEPIDQTNFMGSQDLVVGIYDGQNAKAYPHSVLDWHEIVNDRIGGMRYSIIYCPLTGTATAWNRVLNGKLTTFGVSGLLYNTNIVPYDRETQSNWSQLFDRSIYGPLQDARPVNYMVLETEWETWKTMFPDSEVMNYNTGHTRPYGDYPYGNYKKDPGLIFPVKYHDKRLHEKERVHVVIVNGKARVYRFGSFR